MKTIELYPPNGGAPIIPHPSRVKQMMDQGWTEKQITKRKPKKEDSTDGNS